MLHSIRELLLPEFDREMHNTRRVLERIPPEKLDWRAHEKSNTIGWVGTHLANIVGWTSVVLTTDALDLAPPGGEPYRETPAPSVQAILEKFDHNVSAGRSALLAAADQDFFQPWSLLSGGQAIFTLPRYQVLRTYVLNHLIHHRGHLCVYLRLNNVPVPGLYGPSADEPA
jgi:uncharacterized damage-inducible protein DinB